MNKTILTVFVILLGCFGLFASSCGSTVCDTQGAADCGVTYNSCLQACLDDVPCQEGCTTTYCSCLDDTNCADSTAECD